MYLYLISLPSEFLIVGLPVLLVKPCRIKVSDISMGKTLSLSSIFLVLLQKYKNPVSPVKASDKRTSVNRRRCRFNLFY